MKVEQQIGTDLKLSLKFEVFFYKENGPKFDQWGFCVEYLKSQKTENKCNLEEN